MQYILEAQRTLAGQKSDDIWGKSDNKPSAFFIKGLYSAYLAKIGGATKIPWPDLLSREGQPGAESSDGDEAASMAAPEGGESAAGTEIGAGPGGPAAT